MEDCNCPELLEKLKKAMAKGDTKELADLWEEYQKRRRKK
ncbi:hypothetical protein [Sulfolobus polyhedral virus 1]|uniref:Uncharacterized protein n=2 Tax=Alphaportoglobovirus TaxID=2169647 RepID=A0A1W6I147_SPV1|nr:hypothetical protein DT302_gp05 [Sulfolobus polyhedral virus 1]YP_010084255.1 hypothetical protein KM458_gp05 [Sulfolobus polyhedral virus 2]ARM37787.1 hypothetical protein [Sulfolobus polyhedral virus 1]AZI76004.1 hypothetical protein SPV2_gp05 [Sulfolobus polyhedral virus 2]